MENSLKVCASKATCADTYIELPFQTAIRSSMWAKRPEPELVSGWIEQALELSEPDSVSRAKALIARCFWERDTAQAAHEASELAERLGDVDVRSYAAAAAAVVAFAGGEFESALAWSQRQLTLLGAVSDPDHVADIYEASIPCCCAMTRFEDARRFAAAHASTVEPLSAHHRLHGIAVLLEVEEVCGRWERILELAERTEAAVDANLATPCVRNARSLLVTALAAAYAGDDEAARRYERRAEEVATEGYDFALSGPRTWLALLRGEMDDADTFVEPVDLSRGPMWYALPAAIARLDALAAVRDRSLVETEASALLRPGTYLEPFALRALGVVREDAQLIEQAVARLVAMGFGWHAEQARRLAARG